MDSENMRFQEGILLDKMKVHIGIKGASGGVGTSFVARWLDYFLNDRERHHIFVSRPDRYIVEDSPSNCSDMDIIVGVIDPLPSLLMDGADGIGDLMDKRQPVIWMLNRNCIGVNRRELKRYLGFIPEFCQEDVPREYIVRAEYNGENLPDVYKLGGIEELAEYIKAINNMNYE